MSLILAIAFGIASALVLGIGAYAYFKARAGTAAATWQENLVVLEIAVTVIAIGLVLGAISAVALIVHAL